MTEYLAENARLHQLSRRHAEGLLTLEEYRAGRRDIIAALEAGQAQAQAPAQPGPAAIEAVGGEADSSAAAPPEDDVAGGPPVMAAEMAQGWDTHTRILATVLGISLLLAVSALVYVFAL